MSGLEDAARVLRNASSVVVLTGAGVSADSGIPTFRGTDGLWRRYRVEDLATPQAFAENPKLVWEFYDWRRQMVFHARPNEAHFTVARMEKKYSDFMLLTQNIDGLHSIAGSRRIVELHGNIWRMRCLREGITVENLQVPLKELPPTCSCGSLMRPDVVWFGEPIPHDQFSRAQKMFSEAEVILVIGRTGRAHSLSTLY